jgi:hypothetical protein
MRIFLENFPTPDCLVTKRIILKQYVRQKNQENIETKEKGTP